MYGTEKANLRQRGLMALVAVPITHAGSCSKKNYHISLHLSYSSLCPGL